MIGFDATRGVRRKERRASLFLLTLSVAIAPIQYLGEAHAQVVDSDSLAARVAGACPRGWTDVTAPFLGGEVTVADPWSIDAEDREAFLSYLHDELAGEGLAAAEYERLAADPLAVVSECAHAKVKLIRHLAAQNARVAIADQPAVGELPQGPDFPNGLIKADASTSCEAIVAAWPDSPNGEYWIDPDGGDTFNAELVSCRMTPYPDGSAREFAAPSCNELNTHFPGLASGVYWIDTGGGDDEDAFEAYCDMTSHGGGWTMVVAQFEADQLTDWNEGIQPDYDPTLAGGRSFALSGSEIPAHDETAFGKGLDPTFIDYGDHVYSTFDIETTIVIGKKSGKGYHVHRDSEYSHHDGDPEIGATATSGSRKNSLTFDELGGSRYTWWYTPRSNDPGTRGRSMLGTTTGPDDFAWTVWVR